MKRRSIVMILEGLCSSSDLFLCFLICIYYYFFKQREKKGRDYKQAEPLQLGPLKKELDKKKKKKK